MIEDTEMTEATTAMSRCQARTVFLRVCPFLTCYGAEAVGVPLMTDTLRIGTIDVMTDRVITTAGMIDTTEIMSAGTIGRFPFDGGPFIFFVHISFKFG